MNTEPSPKDTPEVTTPSEETLVLLREISELLIAIHNLQNEQLHVLNSINTRMP